MNRVVVVACLAVMLGLASHPTAQSPAGPAFEVASVKPSNPDAGGLRVMPPVAGRFTASNVPPRDLVRIAYDLFEFQIDGGPDWLTSRRFDIQAKSEEPVVGIDAMRPMLKALLADRFQLKVHSETREMPIYALVVAGDDQRGAKITPSTTDCPKAAEDLAMGRAGPGAVATLLQGGKGLPCAILPVPPPLLPAAAADSMTVRANGASMADLARFLTPYTGRPVQDRTGLSSRYDWEMTFGVVGGVPVVLAARPGITLPPRTPPTPPGAQQLGTTAPPPTVMIALQEQLGLKLESTRGDDLSDDSEVRRAHQNGLSARTDRFRNLGTSWEYSPSADGRLCSGFLACQGVAAPLPSYSPTPSLSHSPSRPVRLATHRASGDVCGDVVLPS